MLNLQARERYLLILAAVAALIAIATQSSPAFARGPHIAPNVLIIVVDDMRFDQMTHAGHPYIETPHLDRLAREGMRFVNAYVTSPLCGPSRASIMTGRQPSVHGRFHNHAYPELQPYLPTLFRAAGYRTAMIGKFYEGDALAERVRTDTFDRWYRNGGPYWPDFRGDPENQKARRAFYNERLYYDQFYEIDGETKRVMGYQTDVLFDEAARFAIESLQADQPFFVLLNPFAPHTPLNSSPERLGKHRGKGIPPRENLVLGSVGPMKQPKNQARMAEVHERGSEMIEDIDMALGRCLNRLEAEGVLDSTLIIFTSDNGTVHGEHGFWWKMNFWQEAIRVPLLIRYPPLVEAGATSDVLVSLADVLPTAAAFGRIDLPEDPSRYGRSILPYILGETKQVRAQLLCLQYSQPTPDHKEGKSELTWATLTTMDGWKLIAQRVPSAQNPDLPDTLLFYLPEDPLELQNLADSLEHRSRLERLKSGLADELLENHAPADWIR